MAVVMERCSSLGTPVQSSFDPTPSNLRTPRKGDFQNAGQDDPRTTLANGRESVTALMSFLAAPSQVEEKWWSFRASAEELS